MIREEKEKTARLAEAKFADQKKLDDAKNKAEADKAKAEASGSASKA